LENFSLLSNKISTALKLNKPFTAYQKPNSNTINLIIQENNNCYFLDNYLQKGFVFAPFNTTKKTILFPLTESVIYKYTLDKNEISVSLNTLGYINEPNFSDKKKHLELVSKGIENIKNFDLKKVVLSRKEIVKKDDFSALKTFLKLIKNYPLAFVYIWYHPKVGLWLGASPEALMQVKNNHFKTMALAGTKEYNNTLDVSWQKKEIDEQQFVTEYISNKLIPLNIPFKTSDAYTVKAGNLLHLRTDISGRINSKNQLEAIIKSLHPTPAVCGLPKEKAKQFILENENYNREFYTGFLGELNFTNTRKRNIKNIENQAYNLNQTSSDLFVNLRCMKINNEKINLYIGGGITKDSNPESEFLETVVKSKIIKKCL
jgi:isochorismate synthase